MAEAKAYIVGTLDTKGEELLYIRDLLAADGVEACVVDVGTGGGPRPTDVDVSNAEVATHHPDGADAGAHPRGSRPGGRCHGRGAGALPADLR